MADRRDPLPSDGLDPMIRRFVDDVSQAYAAHADLAGMSNAEARGVAEIVRRPWREGGPEMARIEEILAPAGDHDVRVRFYHPPCAPDAGAPRAGVVYLHGGGWTLFSLDTHDRVMREYAARSGLVVVGVDYSLSPEVKFPSALDEVAHVLRWLARDGARFGLDPDRLLVGGDSAGANLAIAACLSLRNAGQGGLVCGMLLNYGVFGTAISEESVRRFGGPGFMLSAHEMATFWSNYLNSPADAANPLACPLLADLRGLPPAFLTIPECDILAEQSVALADRLRSESVAVRDVIYGGAAHSFLEAVSIAPLSQRALAEGSSWLREISGSTPRHGV